MNPNPTDLLRLYDETIKALETEPDSLVLMHRAVLTLARAGSLDFALEEYSRYGLDKIRNHEDIMALGGRLLKDKALIKAGKARTELAQQSSEIYEAAFKDTGGYYSGINAATMALIGGIPEDIVKGRAETVLKSLPSLENLSSGTLYFVEATRAEAFLLLGRQFDAQTALRRAFDHDPQNYTAHASTLKQFRLIEDFRGIVANGDPADWLSEFSPPRSIHFAGHMFTNTADKVANANHPGLALSKTEIAGLKRDIADAIQTHDIGFGFGALAAGADILIAETLLEEGAHLHVVLPVNEAAFMSASVLPFGEDWAARFKACLAAASSVMITSAAAQNWPSHPLARYGSTIAMGKAVMHARSLSAPAAQLLIWDGDEGANLTGTFGDAADWRENGKDQLIIPYPAKRTKKPASEAGCVSNDDMFKIALKLKTGAGNADKSRICPTLESAIKSAFDFRAEHGQSSIVTLHIGLGANENAIRTVDALSDAIPHGGVYCTEEFSAFLASGKTQTYSTPYLGLIQTGQAERRLFGLTLNPINKRA